jgi:hypothetical protein
MKRRAPADYRTQGIAAALGELADAHFERDLAQMVLESLNLDIAALRQAGADPFDLERLEGDTSK